MLGLLIEVGRILFVDLAGALIRTAIEHWHMARARVRHK